MPTGIQQAFTGLICCRCNQGITDDTYHDNLCSACSEDVMVECPSCFEIFADNELVTREESIVFRINGIWTRTMINAQDSGEYICVDCSSYCDGCGQYYHWEDSAIECCEPEREDCINYYSYRPVYNFSSYENGVLHVASRATPGLLYMGVEIEVEQMRDVAADFYDQMSKQQQDFVYMKEDGSLSSSGVEIVTMPATLGAFEASFPFDALDNARARGARSFAYGSCGFHIHVSRSAFTATHLWKFVKFQLMNPELCQFIGQRSESSYATWYYDDSETKSLPDYVKGKKSNGRRYLAINFQNTHTVELRYFKGNILRSAIMKNLEFVDSIYQYTKNLGIRDVMSGGMEEQAYKDWLENNDGYENLKSFISIGHSKEMK